MSEIKMSELKKVATRTILESGTIEENIAMVQSIERQLSDLDNENNNLKKELAIRDRALELAIKDFNKILIDLNKIINRHEYVHIEPVKDFYTTKATQELEGEMG